MSLTTVDFTKPYAGATGTTLLTITGAGVAANYVIKIMGTTDDNSNTNNQSVDMSYLLVWDGTNFISMLNFSGTAPAAFTWSISGNVASFNFTPVGSAGNIGIYAILGIPNSSSLGYISY